MTVEYAIISIGTLSANRLWGESAAVRTAHATTTLVRAGERVILVDPSLPAAALAARFGERTGRTLADVTDVFCTTLRPAHRRGVAALPNARWWCGELELETFRAVLEGRLDSAGRLGADEAAALESDLRVLQRFAPAPEKFGEQAAVIPLPGPTDGSMGLLLTPPTTTIVVAGDAAVTAGHVERGQVWEGCADAEAALRTLQDMLELADVIVPGHDNLMLTPRHWL